MTRRQEIIEMLKVRTLTLQNIADEFLTTQEEIAEDLKKIQSTVRPQYSLEQTLPACHDCGFTFKDRYDKNKVKPPSKCPKCHGEGIEPPQYFIKEHKENIPKELRLG